MYRLAIDDGAPHSPAASDRPIPGVDGNRPAVRGGLEQISFPQSESAHHTPRKAGRRFLRSCREQAGFAMASG